VTAVAARPRADTLLATRLLAALPLLTAFSWLALVYAWQAWLVTTPVIYSDELLYAELSRSFAETGHTLVRGEPHPLESLSVVARAPAWLLGDLESAYYVAKLIGVGAMTAAIFPAYALARLLVSPRPALFAAAATVTIPALSYSALLLEEPFAYPFATLAFFLGVRALARPTIVAAGAAVLVALVAPFVRGELVLVPFVLAAAALVLAWKSERVQRRRARLRPWDLIGLAALAALALVALQRVAVRGSIEWEVAADRPGAMLDNAAWAAAALTIGVGVVPVVAALAALVRPAGAPRSSERRAFTAVFLAAVPAFLVYTAGKGAWLETILEPRILERNVIYLAPLVFVGMALWLEHPRLRPLAVLAAGLTLLPVLVAAPIELGHPYFEAPGYSLAAFAERELFLSATTIATLLLVALALAVAVILAARRVPVLAAVAAVVVLAWNIGGEVYVAVGFRDFAQRLEGYLPAERDWIDRETRGASTVYLGQRLDDPNPFYAVEFWNKSLDAVWVLDRSVLPPGRTGWAGIDQVTGEVVGPPGARYAVLDSRLAVVGREVRRVGAFTLYRIAQPLRVRDSVTGLYGDGWMASSSAYTRYSTPGRGHVEVTVGRTGWGGTDVPSPIVVRIGPVADDGSGRPALASVTAERRGTLHSLEQHVFRLPAPPAPFRVEVSVPRTFVPSELDPRLTDTRPLGAQVAFGFVPAGGGP
jgi:hypothetical protein